jgi:hypothetical protein
MPLEKPLNASFARLCRTAQGKQCISVIDRTPVSNLDSKSVSTMLWNSLNLQN